ncbi:MAG: sensor histidine kinase [Acidimicrobiales bacterium]
MSDSLRTDSAVTNFAPPHPERRAFLPSPIALVTTMCIVAVAVGAFAITRQNTANRSRNLLEADAAIVAASISQTEAIIATSLGGLANLVAEGDSTPGTFGDFARALRSSPLATLALVRRVPAGFSVEAVVGSSLTAGEVVTGPPAQALAEAGALMSSTPPFSSGRSRSIGFAVGPPLTPPGTAVYEQVDVTRYLHLNRSTEPYGSLDFALYASTRPAKERLILATTSQLPLSGEVARATIPVGGDTWLLVAKARLSLIGPLERYAAWTILAAGALIGMLTGITAEVLVRRRRYAQHLVELRTKALDEALDDLQSAQTVLVRNERFVAAGEIAAGVGHDLRNPLAAVTNAHWLLHQLVSASAPDPDTAKRFGELLAIAEQSIASAVNLSEDLMTAGRPRPPSYTSFALSELANEVIQLTVMSPGVIAEVDVGPYVIEADRAQMAEVLTNLVANADQAMPHGGTLRVEASKGADEVEIRIKDTGGGIDPQMVERVFDAFVTTRTEGTGLGLAIVRRLVEAHKGTVALENLVGGGTQATLRLPLRHSVEVQ